MEKQTDRTMLLARAETHAAMLEAAATLMELDGIGLDPEHGQVEHLRRMAGAIRAQAALGKLAQTYPGARYLPGPTMTQHADRGPRAAGPVPDHVWH